MMAYGGDVCSGYVASYEGDAWSWAGQSWGGYPHVQYDASTWDYQQQPQQSWTPNPGPKVGAELLTELRLAELKRLIDRDAESLKKSSEADREGRRKSDFIFEDSKRRGLKVEAEDLRDTGQGSACAQGDAAAPLQGGAKLAEAPVPTAPQPGDDVSDAASTQDRPASSEQEAKAAGKAKAASSSSEAEVAARLEAMVPHASPSASPRGPGQERCYQVLLAFEPGGRSYGELPVREGERVFVSSEPVDGWIFGVRRGADPDEGWLPASALGLGSAEDVESFVNGAVEAAAAEEQPAQRQRRARGRGAGEAGRGAGAGRRTNVGQQQYMQQPSNPSPKQHAQQPRKADYGRSEPQQVSNGPDRSSGGSAEQQPWHHHGNWWSRQRHLKPQESKETDPRRQQQWGASRQPGHHGAGQAQGAGQGRAAAEAADSEEEEEEPAVQAVARGRGGRGRGGRTRPVERTQHRARPALTSLLDRLNKPLVAPKPAT